MKKYIFMAYGISNIGGAQIYYYNKIRYCEQKGWDVYVFSTFPGTIYIEFLKRYKPLINVTLGEFPHMFSKRKVKKTIKWMLNMVDYHDGDEVLIESGDVIQGTWGELLAKACDGRNILNSLGEGLCAQNRSIYDFLEFKWKRKELRCIDSKILRDFFCNKNLNEDESYGFVAPCTNSMEDIDIPVEIDIIPDRPTIGIIGRINKNYIFATVKEVLKFAENHPDKFYNILVIGGGEKTYYNQLFSLVKNKNNIKLVITGILYPIPKKLIEKITVAIGSSGSIRLPWSLEIPSIAVELNSNMALGFLGYDTKNTQFALDNEKLKNISDCLEDFFFNSYIENHNGPYIPVKLGTPETRDKEFDIHFEYIKLTDPKKEYFNKFSVCGIKEKTIKCICSLFGYRAIQCLKKLKEIFNRR